MTPFLLTTTEDRTLAVHFCTCKTNKKNFPYQIPTISRFYLFVISRFVLAAVSPAVVVPSLLNLSDRGYGINKGIPTLVIAAASIDDVLAITGFGVMLGIAFSEGKVFTIMILSFWTDWSGQIVQTQIRLLLEEQSDQGLHYLQYCLHLLDALLYGKTSLFAF